MLAFVTYPQPQVMLLYVTARINKQNSCHLAQGLGAFFLATAQAVQGQGKVTRLARDFWLSQRSARGACRSTPNDRLGLPNSSKEAKVLFLWQASLVISTGA